MRRRVLDAAVYREAVRRLDEHFTISIVDCGSTLDSPVTQEAISDLNALLVVSSPGFTENYFRPLQHYRGPVALVGERLQAGATQALIGQSVQVNGVPFEVVGVLAEKGASGMLAAAGL